MNGQLGLGFLAGTLSTLSPCVLPLLPVLVTASLRQHILAPLALALGLALSFTATGLVVATLGFESGLDPAMLRQIAAALMVAFGVVLLSKRLQDGFATITGRFSQGASERLNTLPGTGLTGQFLMGALLGVVWSPCIGPTLGAAIGLASQSKGLTQAALVMAAFGLGAATPVLVIATGAGRLGGGQKQRIGQVVAWAKPLTGVALVAVGLLVISGADKMFETSLTASMPDWLLRLTSMY